MPQDGKIKTRRSVLIVRTIVLLLLVWIVVAWLAARTLIVTRRLERADALVVLSGSSTYIERAQWAARLYHEQRAAKIILTNDGLQAGYSAKIDGNPLFNELAKEELERAGVPADRIEIITKPGSSTHDEALFLRDYSTQHSLRSLTIVTSAYHSRRALWIFERVFRGTATAVGIESPPTGLQTPPPGSWWLHQMGWKLVPGEYVKLIYYVGKY